MPSILLNSGIPDFILIPVSPKLGIPYSLLCPQHLAECTLWFVSTLVGVLYVWGVHMFMYVYMCICECIHMVGGQISSSVALNPVF